MGSEHIVPFSLGGTAEILKASCKACEDITKKLDGYLANNVFREFRIAHRLQSRSKTTTKTKTMPFTFREKGGVAKTVQLRVEDTPIQVHLPRMLPPGVFRGVQPQQEFKTRGNQLLAHFPPTFAAAVGISDGAHIEFKGNAAIDVPKFARALAKIAYCHFVAYYGHSGARLPKIVEIIRGEDLCSSYAIGGIDGDPLPPEPSSMHRIGLVPVRYGTCVYLVCLIRMFPFAGSLEGGATMPVYQVVLGDITGQPLASPPCEPGELRQKFHFE